jgi:hypothetical protein
MSASPSAKSATSATATPAPISPDHRRPFVRISSMDAIERRLDYIRSRVDPPPAAQTRTPTERVLHGIAKRGLKLVRSARDALGAGDETGEAVRRARDF